MEPRPGGSRGVDGADPAPRLFGVVSDSTAFDAAGGGGLAAASAGGVGPGRRGGGPPGAAGSGHAEVGLPEEPGSAISDEPPSASRKYEAGSASEDAPTSSNTSDLGSMMRMPSSSSQARAIDYQPPSSSVIDRLDCILEGQFGNMHEVEVASSVGRAASLNSGLGSGAATNGSSIDESCDGDAFGEVDPGSARGGAASASAAQPCPSGEDGPGLADFDRHRSTFVVRLVESQLFMGFFMIWTFYALFVPDLDMLLGNKETRYYLSIITTFVFFLFSSEIVLQSIGRKQYAFRAYFWLDIIALVTLLSDTWFFQEVFFKDQAFLAGRSSKVTRLLRIAARSSKATRLNRLTRIVRVASLMPRLGKAFARRVNEDDTDKVIEKKLRRVFLFLDEDMDGYIPRLAALSVLAKIKTDEVAQPQSLSAKAKSLWKSTTQNLSRSQQPSLAGSSSLMSVRGKSDADEAWAKAAADGMMVSEQEEVMDRAVSAVSCASPKGSLPRAPPSPQSASGSQVGGGIRLMRGFRSSIVRNSGSGSIPCVGETRASDDARGDSPLVSFEGFRSILLGDEEAAARLRKACRQQVRQANNMKNLTSKHSEYVAVKVALGVLLLLFVLNMVEPGVQDFAAERGLFFCGLVLQEQFPNVTERSSIPVPIRDQVDVWTRGVGGAEDIRNVIFLDIEKLVYCNEISPSGQNCSQPGAFTGRRPLLEEIDKDVRASSYRIPDLISVRVPDLSDEEVTPEELNERTMSVAVLYSPEAAQLEAIFSITTTVLVIIIILSGITLLTKDMTFLSRNLLRPLRELADEMESIAQLQLAGVSNSEEPDANDTGTSEVRLIRRTFENMKKAIKSWGKYVPWPVVQILLRANVEANLQVNEVEVTIFFSDIASFTTIVESMPPERSLLLLSRYFNDMTKIIDDHGGVVLEFIGDAVLAIYGAPLANEDHAQAGVSAALRMFGSLKRMNEWSREPSRDLPEVKIRCGVHTGRVLVGNMGFHSRMKYGIVGEDAHIPSRLEEMNKNYSTSMLISDSTLQRLPEDGIFTRPIDWVQLRNTPGAKSEVVHEVLPAGRVRRGGAQLAAEAFQLHAKALELYRARDFERAAQLFEDVGQRLSEAMGEEDRPSALLLKRCLAYMARPPPEDWDGVWESSTDPP